MVPPAYTKIFLEFNIIVGSKSINPIKKLSKTRKKRAIL